MTMNGPDGQVDEGNEPETVSILGDPAPMLDRLRTAEGGWLVPDITPLEAPGAGAEPLIAVVDTGVIADHPSLTGRIVEQIDLTGEGVADQHGHGTAVSAILAATVPSCRIISVKALDRTGSADIPRLSLAFREAARALGDDGRVVNVSAGRRNPECTGDCALCATVSELQEAKYVFVCAAGNEPGVTYCPARVAISVTTEDAWAAPGDVVAAVPGWRPEGTTTQPG